MPYHFPLTLEQRATLSIAISIWDSYEIKKKITKWSNNYQHSGWSIVIWEWKQLIKEAVEKRKQIPIPSRLQAELFHVVKALGVKIFNWYEYIQHEYQIRCGKEGDIINYIRKIYWTSTGTIDEVKILQSYWMKNPNLDVAVLYNIACKNALEKNIDDLWQKMPSTIKENYDKLIQNNVFIYDDNLFTYTSDERIVFGYWEYRRDGRMNHFTNFLVSNDLFSYDYGRVRYNQNSSVEHNMFLLSVHNGYSSAAKYFWNKLTQEERDSSILDSAYVAVIYGWLWNIVLTHIKEKYVDILMFLMNQMTISQKESFLRDEPVPDDDFNNFITERNDVKSGILPMFLRIWPWQELFLPVLSDMLQYPEHNKHLLLEVLFEISKKMQWSSYAANRSKYRSIFHEVWLIIPGSIKQTMILDDAILIFFKSFIVNLLTVGDFNSIKMIFNDPEIADVRIQCIKLGQRGYENLIESNKYELLDKFMEEVLRSKEEKNYIKSLIDHNIVYRNLIKTGKYDSAEQFLNWKFETAEEIKQCKNHFKDHDFFISWVLDLDMFEESLDKTKLEMSKFLEWVFQSKDEISCFKKEVIIISESRLSDIDLQAVKETLEE